LVTVHEHAGGRLPDLDPEAVRLRASQQAPIAAVTMKP
jgi:hypothetical protein